MANHVYQMRLYSSDKCGKRPTYVPYTLITKGRVFVERANAEKSANEFNQSSSDNNFNLFADFVVTGRVEGDSEFDEF